MRRGQPEARTEQTVSERSVSYGLKAANMTHTISHSETDASTEATHETQAMSSSWELRQVGLHLGDNYQVVRELGKGGMGVVFLARDIALHRLVAIKVLKHDFASSEDHRERFRREARMTARLSHPNIVPVHTFVEVGEFVCIVMKYVHGESLAVRLRRDGAMNSADSRRLLIELAAALDYAHREGVVHRDLKAENILIERGSNRAMLTDFGVALLRSLDARQESGHYGTPHYMSPEQAAGEADLDGRSDLYSLGVLGYYMTTGRLPFHALTFEALAAKQITEAHVPLKTAAPKLDADVAHAIEMCLEKDRDDRWRHGRFMADALSAQRGRTGIARVVRRLTTAAATVAIGVGIPAAVSAIKTWMAV
jgi:serine/threonine protein kinase